MDYDRRRDALISDGCISKIEPDAQMLMRRGRVAAPIVRPRFFRRDVVAGAEAAAFGLQQDDACFCVLIRPQEGSEQLMLQLRTDGVELFRTV